MIDDDIAAHYAIQPEGERLFAAGEPRLEFVRTMEILERYLPPAPASVLDVGGATGVYALKLAERGHDVRLVDALPHHVAAARASASQAGLDAMSAAVGDARSLDEADATFDAVLLLGPLYHLTETADRDRALREAHRVLRPGGVLVAAAISRYASLLDGLKRQLLNDPVFRPIVEQDVQDGQHRNPDVENRPDFFTTAYFHHPDELEVEVIGAGFERVLLLAVEGPGWIVDAGRFRRLDESPDMEQLVFAARAVETERSLMGATSHFVAIGIRPPSS